MLVAINLIHFYQLMELVFKLVAQDITVITAFVKVISS